MSGNSARWSWASAVKLTIVALSAGASMGLLAPLVAMSMKQRGIPEVEIGIVSLLYYVGNIVGANACSVLVRRYGTRWGLGGCTMLAMGSTLLLAMARTGTDFAILRTSGGVANGGLVMLSQVALVSAAPEAIRSVVAGGYALLFGIGTALGPALNGVLLRMDDHAAFAVGTWCVALGGLALLSLPFETAQGPYGARRRVAMDFGIRIALHGGFAYGMAESVVLSLLPVRLLARGATPTAANSTLSLFVVGSLIGTLPATSLADKLGRSGVLSLCAAMGVVLIAMFEYVASIDFARVFAFGAGACIGPLYAIALSLLGREESDLHEFRIRATWFTIAFALGCIAGPASVTAMLLCQLSHLWLVPLLVAIGLIPIHWIAANFHMTRNMDESA